MFNNLLRLIATVSAKSFASGGAWQAQVQGIAVYAKRVVDELFGIGTVKVTFEHILLFGILLVLIGIWRGQAPPKGSKKGAAAPAAATTPAHTR
jgi:hypothetical protein